MVDEQTAPTAAKKEGVLQLMQWRAAPPLSLEEHTIPQLQKTIADTQALIADLQRQLEEAQARKTAAEEELDRRTAAEAEKKQVRRWIREHLQSTT